VGEELRFERFDKARHDRASFDCGVERLNDYLKTRLGQHTRKNVTRGYVLATPEGRIAGYLTLAAGRLAVGVIPEGHGFPARMPLPTTLLGRLAVDRSFRGRGLGGELLMHALNVAVETAETIASAVIEVDAKDEGAKAFYERYGFRTLPDDRLHMYLAMGTAKELVRGW
jgi:ribosomal protein S18 acetylase RimI-like enzyme